jgi:hypothetical protein
MARITPYGWGRLADYRSYRRRQIRANGSFVMLMGRPEARRKKLSNITG